MAHCFRSLPHRHCSNGDRGFSLVELLIAATIGAVVLGAVVSYSVLQFRSNANQERLVQLDDDANRAADWIASEIGRASGFDNTVVSGCSAPTGTSLVVSMRIPGAAIAEVSYFSPTGSNVGNVIRCGPPVVCTSGTACRIDTAASSPATYLVASNARLAVSTTLSGTAVRQIAYTLTLGTPPLQLTRSLRGFAGAPTY
jgi:prepilin-type N-terminal cleavage/methylation domain-containing protein